MRQILFYIIFACTGILAGCSRVEKAPLPIESFMIEFLSCHSDFNNNDLTKKIGNRELAEKFYSEMDSLTLLDGVFFKVKTIAENDSCYMVQFIANGIDYHQYAIPQKVKTVNLDIVSKLNKEEVLTLKDNELYRIKCKLVSKIDDIKTFKLLLGAETTVWSKDIEYEYDFGKLNLGMIYVDIDSIN